MAIPVIAIPQEGRILARPRFEPLYDTEGYDNDSNVDGVITIFKNSTSFANTGLGLTKQKKRDVNLDAVSGLSIGQHFQWYGLALVFSTMNAVMNPPSTTSGAVYDQIRRLREMTWSTFLFTQRNPYFTVQSWQIPARVEVPGFSTENNINLVGPGCRQARDDTYDVTLGGEPVEFTQLEAWTFTVEQQGLTLTPTVDIYVKSVMTGIFLRGIQG